MAKNNIKNMNTKIQKTQPYRTTGKAEHRIQQEEVQMVVQEEFVLITINYP
jgi:hypothetical protein